MALQDGAVRRLRQGPQRRQRRHGHRRRPAGRRGAGERRMMRRLPLALLVSRWSSAAAAAVRIKDITALRGARDSQLIGYGLVVGLSGTGDPLRNAPFTQQALRRDARPHGPQCARRGLRNRNVASVIVTADLAAGMDVGARLDVTVSALGDSRSLMGGRLLLTQLQSADGSIYASAQGAVAVTGFESQGQGETLSQGVPTAGRIPNGAIVEQEFGLPRRIALDARTEEPGLCDRRADRRCDQCLFARTISAPMRPMKSTAGRSNCSALATCRSRASWPRSASSRSNPTWPRAWFSTREPARLSSARTCRSTVAVTYGTPTVRVNEQPRVSQPNPVHLRADGGHAKHQDRRPAGGRADRNCRRIELEDAGQRLEFGSASSRRGSSPSSRRSRPPARFRPIS